MLIPSPIPELELNWLDPVPGRIGIELELPSLELESELNFTEFDLELPSMELKSHEDPHISVAYYSASYIEKVITGCLHIACPN